MKPKCLFTMERRIKKWLYDILTAMDEIESFTRHGEMTYQEFLENLIVIRAVERDIWDNW